MTELTDTPGAKPLTSQFSDDVRRSVDEGMNGAVVIVSFMST